MESGLQYWIVSLTFRAIQLAGVGCVVVVQLCTLSNTLDWSRRRFCLSTCTSLSTLTHKMCSSPSLVFRHIYTSMYRSLGILYLSCSLPSVTGREVRMFSTLWTWWRTLRCLRSSSSARETATYTITFTTGSVQSFLLAWWATPTSSFACLCVQLVVISTCSCDSIAALLITWP